MQECVAFELSDIKTCVCLSCHCLSCVGKVLIIGGGIANFTNVAATFKVSIVGWFCAV